MSYLHTISPTIFIIRASLRIILLAFLTSCSIIQTPSISIIGQEAENDFQSLIEAKTINAHFEMELIDSPDEVSQGSDITRLLIKNSSNHQLIFQADYSVQIFALNSDVGWQRIQNSASYLGSGEVLDPKKDPEANWFTILSISPELLNIPEDTLIRVYAEGELLKSGSDSGQVTGAFLDLNRSDFEY